VEGIFLLGVSLDSELGSWRKDRPIPLQALALAEMRSLTAAGAGGGGGSQAQATPLWSERNVRNEVRGK
jgi:hypothetical protein